MPLAQAGGLRQRLDTLYARYNRREFIAPDPLQFVHRYADPRDREIVGIVASSLAFGTVAQIVRSVEKVLGGLPEPQAFLLGKSSARLAGFLPEFRHRFVAADELRDLLAGLARLLKKYGSIETAFCAHVAQDDETYLPALTAFVAELRAGSRLDANYLLPSPAKGSACKRWHLFLRWMIRRDDVDPGVWPALSAAKLVVPLDVHMHRVARSFGFTRRTQADQRTALEVTRAFRAICPEDPVRYDFALTRASMRKQRI